MCSAPLPNSSRPERSSNYGTGAPSANAKRKLRQELNEANAITATLSFKDTANALVEGLVENGFEQFEARAAIREAEFEGFQDGGAAYKHEERLPEVEGLGEIKRQIEAATGGRVTVDAADRKISVQGAMSEQDRTTLALALADKPDIERIARRLYLKSRGARLVAPEAAEAKPAFRVPLLAVKVGDLFEPFEKDHFLNEPWAMEGEDPRRLSSDLALRTKKRRRRAYVETRRGKAKIYRRRPASVGLDGWRTQLDKGGASQLAGSTHSQ